VPVEVGHGGYVSRTELRVVPCGRCPYCLQRRRTQWTQRLEYELRDHTTASFVTLTYNNSFVPIASHSETSEILLSLCKRDLQLFFKRLRKLLSFPIRYYAIGEYGGNTERPHYHAIIFGLPPHSPELQEAWTDPKTKFSIGHTHCGAVTESSIAYVTAFHVGLNDLLDDYDQAIEPPFSTMSRMPGLGHSYIGRMREWHRSERPKDYSIPIYGQRRTATPRYFRDRIYGRLEKLLLNECAMEKELDIKKPTLTKDQLLYGAELIRRRQTKLKHKH